MKNQSGSIFIGLLLVPAIIGNSAGPSFSLTHGAS
jgi:hypothetical protein